MITSNGGDFIPVTKCTFVYRNDCAIQIALNHTHKMVSVWRGDKKGQCFIEKKSVAKCYTGNVSYIKTAWYQYLRYFDRDRSGNCDYVEIYTHID